MQIVAVDVGNSSIKLIPAVLSEGESIQPSWPNCRTISLSDLDSMGATDTAILDCLKDITVQADWFVSSVNDDNTRKFREHCEALGLVKSWHSILHEQIPLKLDVETPTAVGKDRLLAAFAAHQLFSKGKDVIVVDCGTAMTIDLVSGDKVFRGGVILAGPKTNLRALSSMTDALPDLSDEKLTPPESVVGRSTRDAMMSGAYFNGLGAIREVVNEMSKLVNDEPVVVGTGGGLGPWINRLPKHWHLVKDLVLDGIMLVAKQQLKSRTDG